MVIAWQDYVYLDARVFLFVTLKEFPWKYYSPHFSGEGLGFYFRNMNNFARLDLTEKWHIGQKMLTGKSFCIRMEVVEVSEYGKNQKVAIGETSAQI